MKNMRHNSIGRFATIAVISAFFLIGEMCSPLYGQNHTDEWEVTLSFLPFLAGIDGEVTVQGSKTSVDASFSDILDVLDFGLGLHSEARKGKYGFFFEPTYMKLSVEEQVDPVTAEVDMEMWLIEFAGFCRLGEWSFGAHNDKNLLFDVLAGARYWSLGNKINITDPTENTFNAEADDSWIDPFVGVRVRSDLTDNLQFNVRGDIGGFGISSEFTWNLLAIFGYNISQKMTMWAGYRFLGVDYEEGNESSLNKFDVTMSGPLLGLGYRF